MRIEGDRNELMARGDALWDELCTVLDDADPDTPLHDPDSPAWTSRDVYAHFWRMHSGSARAIRWELEHGKPFRWSGLDEDELNAARHAEDQVLTFAEARSRAKESRDEYRALMSELSDEQFEEIGRRHADDLAGGHYVGHLEYIREAARGQ